MLQVPDNFIYAISHTAKWQSQEYVDLIFESLKGKTKRDWFIQHAYHCLPLVIGNQYGFILKSLYDFEVTWNGGPYPDDVTIDMVTPREIYAETSGLQSIHPHFGMGTFTFQTTYQLRTSPGINLITINPPNTFIDGIYHMTGVIETDNLRRDFTYNLKITRPNTTIAIRKGDTVGCFLPYPRHFIDSYIIESPYNNAVVEAERECAKAHGLERTNIDALKKHGIGKRYKKGEDVYGNKFIDHQRRLDDR